MAAASGGTIGGMIVEPAPPSIKPRMTGAAAALALKSLALR